MAFYQRYDTGNAAEQIVLIRPSQILGVRFHNIFKASAVCVKPFKHWTATPMLVISTLHVGWSEYLKDLHNEVSQLVSLVLACFKSSATDRVQQVDASHSHPKQQRTGEVDFQKLQTGIHLQDAVHRARHALRSNLEVLEALRREARLRQNRDSRAASTVAEYDAFDRGVEDVARHLKFVLEHIDFLRERLDRNTMQVCQHRLSQEVQ